MSAIAPELRESIVAPSRLVFPDAVLDVRVEAGHIRHHLVDGQIHVRPAVPEVVRHVPRGVVVALPVGSLGDQVHLLPGPALLGSRFFDTVRLAALA
ncbi:hypothetical protein OG890_00525 [Streptomyces anulatus]|uniref:hypothetical protein n=1 Tax=Streptomyces anulatus TaxID=1892 RepID=UPI00225AB8A3|nr:hypothetical protein [Streptomyces anulatus]MCX4482436.1 hypothetical protein [Streptomyces anulatus]